MQTEKKDATPKLPDGTWAVSKEDKAKIRTLGRKLLGLISSEIMQDRNFQVKTIYGAFDYVSEVLNQKRRLVNENMHIVETAMSEYGLLSKIDEPMADEPELTPEEIESAKKQEETAADVVAATPAPSAGPEVVPGTMPDGSVPSPLMPDIEGRGDGPQPV